MKTKNWFSRMAGAAMVALAMAGCVQNAPEVPTAATDWDNVKFNVAVTVAAPGAGGAETRADKTAWETGDRIAVFFDGNTANYALLQYNGTTWDREGGFTVGTSLAANGSLLAMHAGNGSNFGFAEGDLTNIAGELLCTFYDTDGSYTYDAESNTVNISMTLRRTSNIIRVAGDESKDENMEWRLAGNGIKAMAGNRISAVDFVDDPVIAIANLFGTQGIVAAPDEKFTDDTEAVFHVWYDGSNTDPVTLKMYKTSDPTTVYTRTYQATDFTFGVTAPLQGPFSDNADEIAKWSVQSTLTEVVVFAVSSPEGNKLVAMKPDGSDKRIIYDAAVEEYNLRRIALHPEGKKAVVMDDKYNMYIYDMIEKTVLKILDGPEYHPDEAVWHPNGETILFTGLVDGVYRATSIKPDGTDKTLLTSGEWDLYRANYTPDGTKIIAREDANWPIGRSYIATFDATGSNPAKILEAAPGIEFDCPWPVSNDRIFYFHIDEDWITSLCTVGIDGSNPETLETISVKWEFADYLCTNADGTLITYKLMGNEQLFVIRELNGTELGETVFSSDATNYIRFKFGFMASEIFDSLPTFTD